MCGGHIEKVIDVVVVLSQYCCPYLNIPLISYLAGSSRCASEEEKTAAEIAKQERII